MRSLRIKIDTFLFNLIIFLILVKYTFSYLNIEYGWWQRHLVPNIIKNNFLNLPENFQQIVEYVLLPSLVIFIVKNHKYLGSLIFPFVLTFVLYAFNICTSIYNSVSLFNSLYYALKICSPIYLFIAIIINYKKHNYDIKKTLILFIKYISFLAIIGLLFLDESFNRGITLLPIYFADLHTHNYVIVIIFMSISYFIYQKYNFKALYTFFIASFLFLILGYNIRTPLVLYFIYIATILFFTSNLFKWLIVQIALFIPFIVGLLFVYLRDFDFKTFSSGRLSMYEKKMEMLKNYDLLDFLFGRGRGSDLVRTKDWWYADKGSHNDFLTYLVENGIPFTLLFIVLICSLLFISKKTKLILIVLIFGYFVTSLLSNGLAVRPLATYLFFMFFAYIYVTNSKVNA